MHRELASGHTNLAEEKRCVNHIQYAGFNGGEMSAALRFNVMHFMPYVHLPENHKDYKTTWVNFPNKFYDPEKGYELYQRYLEQLVLADRLGFDAVVLNENHNTVYSMMET